MLPRCVRCGLTHGRDDCAIAKNSPKEKLNCVLCKESGHTSNYRGCTYLKKIIDEKIKRKTQVNLNRLNHVDNSINRLVNPNMSFANIVKSNNNSNFSNINSQSFPKPQPKTNQNPSNSSNNIQKHMGIVNIQDVLNDASMDCFGCDFDTLKNRFDHFMCNYNSTEDIGEKRNALFNFILETTYGA